MNSREMKRCSTAGDKKGISNHLSVFGGVVDQRRHLNVTANHLSFTIKERPKETAKRASEHVIMDIGIEGSECG